MDEYESDAEGAAYYVWLRPWQWVALVVVSVGFGVFSPTGTGVISHPIAATAGSAIMLWTVLWIANAFTNPGCGVNDRILPVGGEFSYAEEAD